MVTVGGGAAVAVGHGSQHALGTVVCSIAAAGRSGRLVFNREWLVGRYVVLSSYCPRKGRPTRHHSRRSYVVGTVQC